MRIYWNWKVITSTFFHINFFTLKYYFLSIFLHIVKFFSIIYFHVCMYIKGTTKLYNHAKIVFNFSVRNELISLCDYLGWHFLIKRQSAFHVQSKFLIYSGTFQQTIFKFWFHDWPRNLVGYLWLRWWRFWTKKIKFWSWFELRPYLLLMTLRHVDQLTIKIIIKWPESEKPKERWLFYKAIKLPYQNISGRLTRVGNSEIELLKNRQHFKINSFRKWLRTKRIKFLEILWVWG